MSSFWVHYLDCSFKCNKRTFNKIEKEFSEWCDENGYYPYFFLNYQSKKGYGLLDLKEGDVGWSFDDELIELDNICSKYGTHLKGTYIGEAEGADFRVDIDGTAEVLLDSACADWLLEYPVKKIRKIREYAEAHFNNAKESKRAGH